MTREAVQRFAERLFACAGTKTMAALDLVQGFEKAAQIQQEIGFGLGAGCKRLTQSLAGIEHALAFIQPCAIVRSGFRQAG